MSGRASSWGDMKGNGVNDPIDDHLITRHGPINTPSAMVPKVIVNAFSGDEVIGGDEVVSGVDSFMEQNPSGI